MHLPPLLALRAFECAGRKLSFTLAAEELGVTVGAVSRQISVLEAYLGVRLFVRSNRQVGFTSVGAKYFECISEGLSQIAAATAKIVEVPLNAPVRIATSVSFSLRWLIPRLIGFHSRFQDCSLQITSSIDPVDFRRGEIDARIALGGTNTPNTIVKRLFRPDILPVCGPRFLQNLPPLTKPQDLGNYTLLYTTYRPEAWPLWLSAHGIDEPVASKRLTFQSSCLAYEAAAENLGIAMAQLPLVIDDLRLGRLVAPFPRTVPDSREYNLIYSDAASKHEGLKCFSSWIVAAARKSQMEADEFKSTLAR